MGRIQLTYKADENDPTKMGTLWMNRPDGTIVAVKWAEDPASTPLESPSPVARMLEGLWPVPLLAQAQASTPFRLDGSYDVNAGRSLAFQLGSADLRTRLAARRLLAQAGSRSYRFINDVLDKKITAESDRPLLLDSLSNAIDEIELRGTPFPREGHLKLAVALYDAYDYQGAVYHFEKAGDITGGDPENLARRGHAYIETGSLAKAIQTFNRYLAGNLSREQQAWARNALGVAYRQARRFPESIAERREALKIDPNFAPALNGLAYTYAKEGKNLSEALLLVDRALRQDPTSPAFLGTRAYVLYKLGRLSEALPLMRSAAAKLPNDPDTQNDLKEIEEAVRLQTVNPGRPAAFRN